MRIKFLLFVIVLYCAIAVPGRTCDLCGCYTPQLEALPQTASETPFGQPAGMVMQSWRDRLYLAVAEQFTYFNTV